MVPIIDNAFFLAQAINMTVIKRRVASTETIHHIWDAIVYVRQQKQITNLERISNYLRRKHKISPENLQQQLELAVSDGLIEIKKRVGCKGSKVGIEQESYIIPEKELVSFLLNLLCMNTLYICPNINLFYN